ncbi:MAG TPA: DedA family protein [Methylomirabilota bacterium]|jgi:membrane protein DedA with SNARE-associated domain|nr:DedA family protein [Methylomirabilota bacterium]
MIESILAYSPYVGILTALCLGSLGAPIPEEIPIITAGVLARQEVVRWWVALPLCLAGVLSGDIVLYWAGRHWGEHVLDLWPIRHLVDRKRRQRLAAAYRKNGLIIVFAARHVMGLRAAAFLTAGIARIPFWKFLAADAAAAGYVVPLGFGLAYLFADRVDKLLRNVYRLDRWIAVIALVTLAAWVGFVVWRRSRKILAPDSNP